MSPRGLDVQAQARRFADELSELLNCTICNGVRLSAVATSGRMRAVVAPGIGKGCLDPPYAIPLGYKPGRHDVFLGLSYKLAADEQGEHLMVESSFMGLFTDADMDEVLLHYDYERGKGDGYPEAHLQVEGTSGYWIKVLPQHRRLVKLHLPVGGRRNRPCIEDLVEFVAVEGLASTREGWQDKVAGGRAGFLERQLRAAVRRDPEVTADQLRAMGWRCQEPPVATPLQRRSR